ncbi:hypothetical protein GALMADRAFT_230881 [Galerina marginata CBS 339.88]|uniref:Uncharacterized protein n=1 Tax=Galerina marginata (strain CBS 339.88) TaxID=685588 RepID=A0A067SGE4_GALM3|nr:hypothetical protein GALMADRAFT_230881 [Galerina marginata CBS 339.88]
MTTPTPPAARQYQAPLKRRTSARLAALSAWSALPGCFVPGVPDWARIHLHLQSRTFAGWITGVGWGSNFPKPYHAPPASIPYLSTFLSLSVMGQEYRAHEPCPLDLPGHNYDVGKDAREWDTPHNGREARLTLQSGRVRVRAVLVGTRSSTMALLEVLFSGERLWGVRSRWISPYPHDHKAYISFQHERERELDEIVAMLPPSLPAPSGTSASTLYPSAHRRGGRLHLWPRAGRMARVPPVPGGKTRESPNTNKNFHP